MYIAKENATEIKNSEDCTLWTYDLPTADVSCAVALIDGRYPDSGLAVNHESDEIYFVISGSGVIHTESGDHSLEKGDMYFVEREGTYWVEGRDLQVHLVNAPEFKSEQHENVSE